jgi:hypothetical protein
MAELRQSFDTVVVTSMKRPPLSDRFGYRFDGKQKLLALGQIP